MELFEKNNSPLAERCRPKNLEGFIGQLHLLDAGKVLRQLMESGELSSIIFWGPPGSGKTTLAKIIANYVKANFISISAVTSGVADIRKIIESAENHKKLGKKTILFIDEIHRFNKSQQDALLHSVEDGTITLIGATTENPSFEVISPLLSRCRVFILNTLSDEEIKKVIHNALENDSWVKLQKVSLEAFDELIFLSGGDARNCLNILELAIKICPRDKDGIKHIDSKIIQESAQKKSLVYDKNGEGHYDTISAFIKSIRGSDPDASVYWLARMLESGEDPKFIARRMIILASEDIGNAEPQALPLAVSAFTAIDYIGMPEARIVLSQTATFLASCPKSNSAIKAIDGAIEDVKNLKQEIVPLHLRNAPTSFMKEIGYGKEYKYSHDYDKNFALQNYLPESLKDKIYYEPTENGFEKNIKERLKSLWKKRNR